MNPITNSNNLYQALVQGSYFAVTKDGGLETISSAKDTFRNIFSTGNGAMKREKDILLAMSKLFGPSGTDEMSGPVKLSTLDKKTRDIVIPYDKLAEAKNRIATMFVEKEFTAQDLIDVYKFSPANAARLHECLLDNIESGFFRPMLKQCVDPDSIFQCIDKLVVAAKEGKGAFLMGLDPDNSFPKIWQDIKDTQLRDSHNLKADRILGQAFKEFEAWTKTGPGKTADKSTMASWVENSCPEIRAAILAYPRDHGYAAYHGLVDDKMRLGRLLQDVRDDPTSQSAISFALWKLEGIREVQPKGELTPKNIWRGCFGNEPMPPEAKGKAFSAAFVKRFDEWLQGRIQGSEQTPETLSLMKRMIKEIDPMKVVLLMVAASTRLPISISKNKLIDSTATLTLVPKKGENPIESMQRDIPLRHLVMRPDQNGTLAPHPSVISSEDKTFPVGDPSNWGEGDANMALSDDEIKKYKEGKDSKYAEAIKKEVQDVCRGNGDKQFDAVMRYLSNALMEHLFGATGVFLGLANLHFTEHTGVDMKVSRDLDGSARVTINSPVAENGWSVNCSLVVAPNGSLKDSDFALLRRRDQPQEPVQRPIAG